MKTAQAAKVKTRGEIAEEYGICTKTLTRWLKKEEIQLPNRLVSPKAQALIYERFGNPKKEVAQK
ncbi:MAG: hypothetical protein R2828_21420 [Saprospiraceae bacterium]